MGTDPDPRQATECVNCDERREAKVCNVCAEKFWQERFAAGQKALRDRLEQVGWRDYNTEELLVLHVSNGDDSEPLYILRDEDGAE